MKKTRRKSAQLIENKSIQELREQFRQWRESKNHPRTPIPQGLWNAAVRAARSHGIVHVSKALGLDYSGLKRRVNGGKPDGQANQAHPAFVRLDTNLPQQSPQCVVELEGPSGVTMKIGLGTQSEVLLPALVEVFGRSCR